MNSAKSHSNFTIKTIHHPPTIYEINLNESSVEELYEVYSNQILIAAATCDVEKAIVGYVNTVVEPVGWNAVWRTSKSTSGLYIECDVLVEVLDVSMHELRSCVKVLGVIESTDWQGIEGSLDCQSTLEILANDVEHMVPLTELYPVSEGDDEGFFLKTAVAIEYIRFFYQNLWRPWDEEDDDDVVFAEKYLKLRLKLYFDIQYGVIPETMALKVSHILEQGWIVREKLNNLHTSMRISDSESEFDEMDVVQSIQLRSEIENLQRQLELMENTTVRNMVMGSTNIPSKVISTTSNEVRNFPVLHLVGNRITLENIKKLSSEDNIVIRMYDSPEKTISKVQSGETILIYPGIYKCLSLGWIEDNVTVKGVGNAEEIVIEGLKGGGDIFLNCQAPEIFIENLTLKPNRCMKTTILVHKGTLHAKNCHISGGDNCIVVLEDAFLILDTCNILYANIDGIDLRCGSRLSMKLSSVHHCEGSGLRIEGESDCSFGGPSDVVEKSNPVTNIILNTSQFYCNRNYGIIVEYSDVESLNGPLDWSFLESLPWVDLNLNETRNEHETFGLENSRNGKGNIGVSYNTSSRCNQSVLVSSPPPYDKFLDSISRIKFLSISSESGLNTGEDGSMILPTIADNGDVFKPNHSPNKRDEMY